MKILYIIESLRSGGKERRLVSLIKELKLKNNFEIEIIILSDNIHYKEIYDLNIKIHFLKRNIKKDLKLIFKFNTILKKIKPNIVHCWDNIAAIHFGPICKLKSIPFINSMISTAPPKLPLFSKRLISNAISYPFSDVILTNSKAGLNSFRVPDNKKKFIYNGFDFNRVKVKKLKELVKKELSIKSEKVIGMTASFSDKKDYS
ncbi:MAG: glycosyltransferase, partial [Flavobacteriaceae bacterium]|nr:glycosyltransferase [Flavobacteriaceae bacterium]